MTDSRPTLMPTSTSTSIVQRAFTALELAALLDQAEGRAPLPPTGEQVRVIEAPFAPCVRHTRRS